MRFLRYLFFCLFFTVGAAAVTLSILADEIMQHYRGRMVLDETIDENQRLRELNAQADVQIEMLESDPNLVSRFEALTFRREPFAEDTVFPKPDDSVETAAETALRDGFDRRTENTQIPLWLERIAVENYRLSLFLAGCGLIITCFIFFGTEKRTLKSQK